MTESTNLITLFDNFINHLKKDGKATSTILAYGADVQQFINFINKKQINQLTSVSQETIEEFKSHLAKQKYSNKSISRKLNSLKTFFRYLKKEGILDYDPTASVEHPKYEILPPRVLTKTEYRALRDACRDDIRMAAIIELFLQTGIKIGELARLELDDIKKEKIRIRAYESQPERIIPLNYSAAKALERYLEIRPKTRTRIVFVTKTGQPLLIRNIRTAVCRFFRIAGIKNATVNDLRHTFIAHQLAAGTSVVTVQRLVGHKRLSTTERYLSVVELIKEKTEEKIKLEEL